MSDRLVGAVAMGVLAAVLGSLGCGDDRAGTVERLPPMVASDDVVAELTTELGRVREGGAGERPRIEGVQPARSRGRRLALVAAAPAAVEYDVAVPEGGVLRVGTAVAFADDADRERAPAVRFRVRVEGAPIWERVWGRDGEGRRVRHWVDAEIDLDGFAGRTVSVSFETEVPDGSPCLGKPAWSRLQVVRRTLLARRTATPAEPNVLLLVVDTLRADRVGPGEGRSTLTPNLDAMAGDGSVFRNAWAQAPWTLPSVATILTGRYPRAHGVVGRSAQFGRPAGVADEDGNWAYLPDTIPTIASLARGAAITTVGVTSNLLVSRENNLAKGFETFVELPVSAMPIQWARADEVHRTFNAWLEANGDHRFFGYLHYMEPHDPYVPTPERRRQCPRGAPDEVCDGIVRNLARTRERGEAAPFDAAIVRYLSELYDGEVAAWDAEFANLLAMLERHGLRDRTVIVVTADHGEEFAEHGHLGHRKQLYAESLAVPLVIAGPGVPKADRGEIVELVDVLPTVATVLGLVLTDAGREGPLPGKGLLSGPTGRGETFAETRYGVIEDDPGGVHEMVGVRDAEWTLLRVPEGSYGRLYDRAADAGEHRDLSRQRSEVVARLGRSLSTWRRLAVPPAASASEAAPLTDKLRALGYVE